MFVNIIQIRSKILQNNKLPCFAINCVNIQPEKLIFPRFWGTSNLNERFLKINSKYSFLRTVHECPERGFGWTRLGTKRTSQRNAKTCFIYSHYGGRQTERKNKGKNNNQTSEKRMGTIWKCICNNAKSFFKVNSHPKANYRLH